MKYKVRMDCFLNTEYQHIEKPIDDIIFDSEREAWSYAECLAESGDNIVRLYNTKYTNKCKNFDDSVIEEGIYLGFYRRSYGPRVNEVEKIPYHESALETRFFVVSYESLEEYITKIRGVDDWKKKARYICKDIYSCERVIQNLLIGCIDEGIVDELANIDCISMIEKSRYIKRLLQAYACPIELANRVVEIWINSFGIREEKEEFKYYIVDNQVTLTYYQGESQDVIIPDELDGFPVTRLDGTFKWRRSLNTIRFGKNVKYIAAETFYHGGKMQKIEFNSGLEILEPLSFCGWNIEEIIVPESVYKLNNAFVNCRGLKTIKFKNSRFNTFHNIVYDLEEEKVLYAFEGARNYYISDGTRSIDKYAFWPIIAGERSVNIKLPDTMSKADITPLDYWMMWVAVPNDYVFSEELLNNKEFLEAHYYCEPNSRADISAKQIGLFVEECQLIDGRFPEPDNIDTMDNTSSKMEFTYAHTVEASRLELLDLVNCLVICDCLSNVDVVRIPDYIRWHGIGEYPVNDFYGIKARMKQYKLILSQGVSDPDVNEKIFLPFAYLSDESDYAEIIMQPCNKVISEEFEGVNRFHRKVEGFREIEIEKGVSRLKTGYIDIAGVEECFISIPESIKSIEKNAIEAFSTKLHIYVYSKECILHNSFVKQIDNVAIIYCYKGSTTEEFAIANNLRYEYLQKL